MHNTHYTMQDNNFKLIFSNVLSHLLFLVYTSDMGMGKPLLHKDELKVVYSFSLHHLENIQCCPNMELSKIA